MIKKLLFGLLIAITSFILIGCGQKEMNSDNSTFDDVYNKIGEYFGNENVDRSNLGAYYIDSENGLIVIVLVDNSVEKQEDFKKNAKVDSKYLKFVQGGPYSTHRND